MKKFPISSNSMSYNISIFKTKLSMLMLASLSDVSKLSSIGSVIYVPYLQSGIKCGVGSHRKFVIFLAHNAESRFLRQKVSYFNVSQ